MKLLVLSLLMLLISLVSQADLKVVVENSSHRYSAHENISIEKFIEDALRHLPPIIRQDLGSLNLRFTKLDPYSEIKKTCAEDEPLRVAPRYGRFNNRTIELNANFLPIIYSPHKDRSLKCGHKSILRLAQATLLHELIHAYDSQYTPDLPAKALRQLCISARTKSHGKGDQNVMSHECRVELSRRYRISDEDRFRHLTGWSDRSSSTHERRNQNTSRLAEFHEATSPQESLAVNSEYFLLDPQFKCRRPALFRYLSKKFEFNPAQDVQCSPLPLVFENRPTLFKGFDRLYQIQLLLADPGDTMASRFGHAMFRLVICAPFRKAINSDCLMDLSSHLVISPRGMIDGLRFSNLDGLTGAYDSRFAIYRFLDILSQYSKMELRNLSAYPLQISKLDQDRLIEVISEKNWIYSGQFYFLSNNCAGEALSLIKSLFDRASLQKVSSYFLTPQGLKDTLVKEGLVNAQVSEGNFFRSKRETYDRALNNLADVGVAQIASLKNFLMLTVDQKKVLLARIEDLPPTDRVRARANFLSLQDYKVSDFLAESIQNSEALQTELEKLSAELHFQAWSPSQGFNRNEGYGIPQSDELQKVQAYWSKTSDLRDQLLAKLMERMDTAAPDIANQLRQERGFLESP